MIEMLWGCPEEDAMQNHHWECLQEADSIESTKMFNEDNDNDN